MPSQAKFGSTHSKWRIMVPVVFIGVMGLVLFTVNGQSKTNRSKSSKSSKLLGAKRPVLKAPEIAGYKKWTLVNQHHYPMPAAQAALCARVSVPPRSSHPSTEDKFIKVFVNQKGRKAMFQRTKPRFAVGSVIVKEKLPVSGSAKPELLTVMIKQRAGYNPKNGDWEYLVADGAAKKVYERGQLSNCQRCHVTKRESDYVFRPYAILTGTENSN